MRQEGFTHALRWGGLALAAAMSLSSSSVTVEDGARQIVLATDRPISAWEAFNRPRSADYDFTLADIRFDGDGKGVGKLAVAAKITTNPKTGVIEIENFSSEPVRLTEVTSDRSPKRSSQR